MADNVITVPPRRRRVYHNGMFGYVEYHPSTKSWSYSIRYQITQVDMEREHSSEAEAVLALKRSIDTMTRRGNTGVRSVE